MITMTIPMPTGSTVSAARTQRLDILTNPTPVQPPQEHRVVITPTSIFILAMIWDMAATMHPPFLLGLVILTPCGAGITVGATLIMADFMATDWATLTITEDTTPAVIATVTTTGIILTTPATPIITVQGVLLTVPTAGQVPPACVQPRLTETALIRVMKGAQSSLHHEPHLQLPVPHPWRRKNTGIHVLQPQDKPKTREVRQETARFRIK